MLLCIYKVIKMNTMKLLEKYFNDILGVNIILKRLAEPDLKNVPLYLLKHL